MTVRRESEAEGVPTEMFFAVDRVQGTRAVLIGEAGGEVTVALSELPRRLTEGMVLRVPLEAEGGLDWAAARIDEEETERRRREAEQILQELRKRDPGGDVKL